MESKPGFPRDAVGGRNRSLDAGPELSPQSAAAQVYFDQVQEIVSREAPFLYLVTKNALVAMSPDLLNAQPAVLRPQTFWNIEMLARAPGSGR